VAEHAILPTEKIEIASFDISTIREVNPKISKLLWSVINEYKYKHTDISIMRFYNLIMTFTTFVCCFSWEFGFVSSFKSAFRKVYFL